MSHGNRHVRIFSIYSSTCILIGPWWCGFSNNVRRYQTQCLGERDLEEERDLSADPPVESEQASLASRDSVAGSQGSSSLSQNTRMTAEGEQHKSDDEIDDFDDDDW